MIKDKNNGKAFFFLKKNGKWLTVKEAYWWNGQNDLVRAFKLGIICPCAIDTSGDKDNLSNDINYLYNFLFTFRTVSVASNQTEWVWCLWTSIPTHMQQIIQVLFENIWELTFHNFLKSVSQEISYSKNSIYTKFVKKPLYVWTIFTNF